MRKHCAQGLFGSPTRLGGKMSVNATRSKDGPSTANEGRLHRRMATFALRPKKLRAPAVHDRKAGRLLRATKC